MVQLNLIGRKRSQCQEKHACCWRWWWRWGLVLTDEWLPISRWKWAYCHHHIVTIQGVQPENVSLSVQSRLKNNIEHPVVNMGDVVGDSCDKHVDDSSRTLHATLAKECRTTRHHIFICITTNTYLCAYHNQYGKIHLLLLMMPNRRHRIKTFNECPFFFNYSINRVSELIMSERTEKEISF